MWAGFYFFVEDRTPKLSCPRDEFLQVGMSAIVMRVAKRD